MAVSAMNITSPPKLDRISDYVQYGAERYPDREACTLHGGATTYGELSRQVDVIANALLAAGVRHGERVATLAPPSPAFLTIFLAVSSIGAIWIGLNPKYSLHELSHPIKDAGPKLIFTRTHIDGRDYTDELGAIARATSDPATIIALDDQAPEGAVAWTDFLACAPTDKRALARARSNVRKEDACLIVYTSGTTGAPKGAVLTHQGLVYCSRVDARYNPAPLGQRMLCNFPINHIACVGDVCCTTLVAGGTIIFMERFDARGVLEEIEKRKVTHLGQIPAMLQMTFTRPDAEQYDLSSLKTIIWGGNPAPVNLIRLLRRVCPNLGNFYGLTETTGNVLFVRGVDVDDETLAVTVGWAPPEYEVALFDEHGSPAPAGAVGEIHVRGVHLLKEYWRRPDATLAAFTPEGWLRTGDLATKRQDGAFQIVGRRSEMYKSGGYNIYPAEVEQAIEMHEGVALAAVVSAPDPLYSEVGHAFVVTRVNGVSEASLRDHCRSILANYKIPKVIQFMQTLPMLPNGKVDKKSLKEGLRAE